MSILIISYNKSIIYKMMTELCHIILFKIEYTYIIRYIDLNLS